MSQKYIIDRVESDYAIIEKENGDMYKIPIDIIKGDFKEGDVIIKNNDEYFEIDKEFTLNRRNKINDTTKNIWKEWWRRTFLKNDLIDRFTKI